MTTEERVGARAAVWVPRHGADVLGGRLPKLEGSMSLEMGAFASPPPGNQPPGGAGPDRETP